MGKMFSLHNMWRIACDRFDALFNQNKMTCVRSVPTDNNWKSQRTLISVLRPGVAENSASITFCCAKCVTENSHNQQTTQSEDPFVEFGFSSNSGGKVSSTATHASVAKANQCTSVMDSRRTFAWSLQSFPAQQVKTVQKLNMATNTYRNNIAGNSTFCSGKLSALSDVHTQSTLFLRRCYHTIERKLLLSMLGLPQHRLYTSGRETVEKKLLQLMDMWEVEDAVALLQQSVREGVVPHPNIVLNLQQQLANLGEVECLLELHDFLKEHKLTSDAKFFQCLQEAYYNSGRISEGVAVLRLLYHRTRKFVDLDVYFTLLTVMVLRHFPGSIHLILSFVTDLKDAEEPVLEPEAALWKCYMLTENWSKADDLLLNNEELRYLIPLQVTRIVQGIDKADFDRATVFTHLLDVPFIRQKLRVLVAETLIAELVTRKQWPHLLKSLKRIKSKNLSLRADKLSPVLSDLQRHLSPQYDPEIDAIRQWWESMQTDATS